MRYSIHSILVVGVTLSLAAFACSSSKSTQKKDEMKGAGGKAMKKKKMSPKKKKKMMKKMMKMDKSKMPGDKEVEATVTQEKGKVTYWVLPGPRVLGDHFGTKSNPKFTGMKKIKNAPPPVRDVLEEHPILVGAPAKARKYKGDKVVFAKPTPFSNKGVPVQNSSLELTYIDRRSGDQKGPPIKTPDEVEAKITFQDPKGNSYEIRPKLVFQPPLPGYKTDGGVMTDGRHHGPTGTGSPLMPEVYTWGAFWAIGDVAVNGEVSKQNKNKVMHCMTTETVRDKNYRLPHTSDLPLKKKNTIAGQMHHTHCIVLPVSFTPKGPEPKPVATAFELPNGKTQPFIHIMYENDELQGLKWNGPTGQ